ncbi:M61 family metallopeptidase [Shewanella surugensis]|uniref:PDZ domain-containing protein n=1 Tax=Shewanella surugensis TaxID=212020 RepID=A0ABT0LED6_9GAMM|nr:PDZ domain-containing protein [Shewanella surugensis]MCL1126043.1 PDZ domain-containing protein [Shewanella surugensis]
MKKSSLSVSLCIPLFCLPVYADVNYSIDVNEPEHHLAKVEIQFPKTKSTALKVNLPIWRTGKYQILPLADNVRLFTASNEQGELLPWQRTASGEWQIELSEPESVTISYQLHANLLGQRVNHISSTHAFLDASGTFMYSPEFRGDKVNVSLSVPAGWKSYSGMEKGERGHDFVAANYNVLVDSPIESGLNQYREFSVEGKQYELVVWGQGNYDLQNIVTDLTKLSSQAQVIWKGYPFSRYLYMVHATSGESGATEHLNSTIIQKPRFSFNEREDYLSFIKTAAHEFIHTWNVKAYRPKGLVPYDYQHEKLSELLWMAEGSTSYFGSQLLLRAGIITPQEFFEDLAKRIALSQLTPGNKVQSVAEASVNQWVSTGDDYAINNSVNIYSEGYLTSLALDFSLLDTTSLAVSYRDVHSQLYQHHSVPKTYDVDDVKTILKTLSGQDYQEWWSKYVESPVQLDFNTLLKHAGLILNHGYDPKMKPFAGMVLEEGSLVLTQVLRDSPAWNAGLSIGDELLAINELKITTEGVEKRLNDFNVGEIINLTVFQEEQLKSVALRLKEQQSAPLQLKSVASPTQEQKAFFTAWLGIQWPFDEKGAWSKL